MGDKETSAFGKEALQQFEFHPEHRNLNHGSFGATPREIRKHMKHYQDLCEAMPDSYIRYEYPIILDECREAMAKFVNVPTDTIVFVSNATTGINTVLHNLTWDDDGKDEIVYFSTVYSGCGKIIDHEVDTGLGRVSSRAISITYPCEDEDIVKAFHDALDSIKNAGKRAKVCLFDVVSSLPGVCFPFEALTKACRDAGVLSLVDGAQGVGMVDIDLERLDPDFFVSNCHKWLFVPKGCAMFYVPPRNQHMITSTMPTSHGYVPRSGSRFNPLPPSTKSAFVNNFEFVGTIDTSPYACVREAIEWRRRVLGGEAKITDYIQTLAQEGGKRVAAILGTEVLDNKSRTLSKCAMTNIVLPLDASAASVETQDWMMRTMVKEYKTFVAMIIHGGRLWARLSAQVYLDMDDFEWTGRMLLELCERVKRGEAAKV
ncbi:putative isopenicillin N epimerase [Rosellinia necatrix]|uniref:Putative isopenicillin N epimerase n=1 Tax=Rosellinia necatrix TaxID=77044 RepID=A0A1W2TFU4_ROSNE|nr:putative isopenicillin N epimerase [Rosellinia necatrix]